MKRYLVTGAAGFVGRALCRSLGAEGHRVRALLRRPEDGPWHEAVLADLAGDPLPESALLGVDGIYHLAGRAHAQDLTGESDAIYRSINVEGTRKLLDAARRAGNPALVYFSSVKAAADPGEACVDEDWDPAPTDAYGRTKREAEGLVLAAGSTGALHVCVLRPALVYGPGVKGNLARMLDAVCAGTFPPVPETGNRRSMVGLDDLIEAARLAMTDARARGRIYIVADGIDYSTRGILEAMCEACGRRPPHLALPLWILRAGAAAGDRVGALLHRRMPLDSSVLARLTGSACYRAERLRAELGWQPSQTLATALPGMVAARRAVGE